MARMRDEAIVLRTRPLGEADLVVTFLARNEGKREGTARSARKSRRRFGGALSPLARGRAEWMESEAKDLVRLEAFEAAVSFADVQRDLAWFWLFAYLSEVADTFARDREPDPRFYRLIAAASDASRRGASPARVRRWFETWTLRLQGLLPGFSSCPSCGAALGAGAVVEAATGDTLCMACAEGARSGGERVVLTAGERAWLARALRSEVVRTPEPGATPGIDRLYRRLFEQFTGRPFRSARFLEARA